jgi:hypothetical protein
MDRQRWMVILGVAALGLYTVSWVFRWMHWPGVNMLRIAAIVPFLAGAGLWIYDQVRKSRAQAPHRSRKKGTGWEDILDEEEEKSSGES